MFLEYYGLIEQPFGVTPDPRFLHLGPKHREALASLVYGTETNRGFLALIAQPGMGKTSLLFQYLEWLRDRARVAFLFQTDCDAREFMRHLLTDLGLDADQKDLPAMHAALNHILTDEMRAGRRFILVIDEAQNLDERVLESVRLLSNFETPWTKLMQIVVSGQPQLAQRLARPSMAQLRQRISSVIRLEPFTPEETNAYLDHRLWVAGYSGPQLFTVGARLLIAQESRGIPRNINNLCFNAMSLAYATDVKQIDSKIVGEAISDLEIDSLLPASEPPPKAFTSSRVFSPFGAPFSAQLAKSHVAQAPRGKAEKRGGWRMIPAIASAAAVLFLGISSSLAWSRGMRTPALDFLPSAEVAAMPAGAATRVAPPVSATVVRLHAEDLQTQAASTGAAPEKAGVAAANGRTLTIVVEKDATLRYLCLEYLGRADEPALLEMLSLNPQINDARNIRAGQRLRLPLYLRQEPMAVSDSALKLASGSSQGERP
jgi:type II secretory pathway predicted ATPase ExeA